MTVTLPAQEIEQAIAKKLQNYARTAKLPGFRPGKVPQSLLLKQYGDSINQEVAEEKIKATLTSAFEQEKIKPASEPMVTDINMKPGESFVYTLTFEVIPELTIDHLEQIEVEKITSKVTAEEVDKALIELQKDHSDWEEVDRPAEQGDRVVIDAEAKIEGEPFAQGSAEDETVEIGFGSRIEGFEEGLIGAKPNSTLNLQLTMPDTYPEQFANKTIEFEIKVHKVLTAKLPELNDEFAAKLKIEGGMEAVREHFNALLNSELEQILQNLFKDNLFKQLAKTYPIELPKAWINNEIKTLKRNQQNQWKRYLQQQQLPVKRLPNLPDELFESEAKTRAERWFLAQTLINQHNIQVDIDKMREYIAKLVEQQGFDESVASKAYDNENIVRTAEAVVLEQQLLELLESKVKLVEKNISFEELRQLVTEKAELQKQEQSELLERLRAKARLQLQERELQEKTDEQKQQQTPDRQDPNSQS